MPNGTAILAFGESGKVQKDIWKYTLKSNKWSKIDSWLIGRTGHTAVAFDK